VVVALPTPLPSPTTRAGRLTSFVDALLDEDLDGLTEDALGEDVIALRREIDRLEAECARRLHRFERRRGFAAQGAASVVSWLRQHCRLSAASASQRAEVARHLPELPAVDHALRHGDIGFQHAAVVARSASELGVDAVRPVEDTLVDAAQRLDPTRLQVVTRHLRHCVDPDGALSSANRDHGRRFLHVSETYGGAFSIDGMLDPEGGALLRTALDALDQPVPGDPRMAWQRRADALVELARRQLQSGDLPSVNGRRPHLTVTVPLATVCREPGAPAGELRWAGPVVAELVRRLACDAAVTRVTVSPTGEPLNVGRTTRTVPPAIRRALVTRDRGCRFPGCDRPPEWTDANHLHHWADGGETSLDNLVLLCRFHHRYVHEQGWHVRRTDGGSLSAQPP